jgi:prepilin-type N-terminal cleavage/methylation domain-containing protein
MKRGFTIVEVMIVVTIIGLLAAILIPSFIKAREKAELDRKVRVAMANGDTNVVQVINESKYKPEFLFEYEGVRVYRFYDDDGRDVGNRWHYFSKQVER